MMVAVVVPSSHTQPHAESSQYVANADLLTTTRCQQPTIGMEKGNECLAEGPSKDKTTQNQKTHGVASVFTSVIQ